MTCALTVTSLGGPTSGPLLYVSLSRASIVSAGYVRRFRGTETRSAPLPASSGFLLFGTVSIRAYSQGLSPLSCLSFSWPAGFSPVPGGGSSGSLRYSTQQRRLAEIARSRSLCPGLTLRTIR